ncbi:MAG: hypothetical protein BGP06_02065 [Rhizobiales bacterium 65-9]|nr:DUF1775 domain-containing protein [Hyphomicrobiales bacterium]OJY34271.1 MAG: hypothetical protein BGP06_02065 [Rhizobiales bacterium 65-9]
MLFKPSFAASTALAVIGASLLGSGAQAHVTFEKSEATAGAAQKMTLRVPHGCAGQPTNAVRVTIPEGVIDIKPMPKAGWRLTAATGPYARPQHLFGKPVAEGVKEILWSGGDLADAFYDEFVFQARFSPELAGRTVAIPVVQECATAKEQWTEIAAPGANAHDLKSPAPTVKITASQAGQAVFRAGPLIVENVWARATPTGAKIGGGYLTVKNNGKEPDRLVGFSSPLADHGELHEMAMTDGVMKMREVRGIDIAPGETISLKPGGLHLMFVDIKRALTSGETIKGRLVFEKAGPVDVEFSVAPIGASRAPGEHSHH